MTGENVTREDILFFKGQFERDEAELKKARDQRKKTRRRAEVLGVDLEVLDSALKLEKENDGTSLGRFQKLALYTQYLSLPIGAQLSFLVNGDGKVSEDDYQKANREGYELGIQGKDPDVQAYAPLTPLGSEHRVGWNEGQEELRRRIGKLDESDESTAPAEDKPKRKRGRPSKAEKAARDAAAMTDGAGVGAV